MDALAACCGRWAEGLPGRDQRRLPRHDGPDLHRASDPPFPGVRLLERSQARRPALRTIYRAKDADAGEAALDAFDAGPWGRKYPAIAQSWRRNWDEVIPFFAFPEAVRRIIYTTDEMDKPFVSRRAIFRLRGRPRGEERGVGWKLRQAA